MNPKSIPFPTSLAAPGILVLGATGKTGSRVLQRLQEQGVAARAGSRRAPLPFDWDAPGSWGPALEGVRALYLSYQPDLAVPGAVDTVRQFVEQAVTSGVEHIVLLSGRGEDEARQAEAVVQASGATWTVLRCAWFAQNFSENFLLGPLLAGELALPVGSVGEPFVDADDIADVAAAALTEGRHAGRLYELTGPRLWTFEQATAEIARRCGRPIRYQQVAPEAYAEALRHEGVPAPYVWLVDYLFRTVLDGRNASVAEGVQQALGRPPRDFADYVRHTAASGVWSSPGQSG